MFERFQSRTIDVGGATIHSLIGGAGEPLLLLHGYPQTHVMWHNIADELAKKFQVVASDLRGYGESLAHDGDLTFRSMARDQVEVMRSLGCEWFHVIAHDRGARTAHRMALDHPEAVRSLVLLDILPTLDVWRTMDSWLALKYYHWLFLAQPDGIPEKLITSDPISFLHSTLSGMAAGDDIFDSLALEKYEEAACRPGVVAAWCGDYRAAATIDREHDHQDEGRASDIACLVLWGKKGVVAHHLNPLDTWRTWFPNARGKEVDAGHFLVEEKPDLVLEEILSHLKAV